MHSKVYLLMNEFVYVYESLVNILVCVVCVVVAAVQQS